MSSEKCGLCGNEETPWKHLNGHICQNCYNACEFNARANQDREKLTPKEIIKLALTNLAEAEACAFELKSDAEKAFAWMIDQAIKYGTVIYNGDCPLDATCDYTAYEQKVYQRNKKLRTTK